MSLTFWSSRKWRTAACLAALGTCSSPALARSRGITSHGCDGCHNGTGAEVSLTADRVLLPGEEAIFTVRITRTSGVQSGGLFIPQPASGSLRTLTGEGLAQVSGGLTHSQPKAAASGAVTFRFGWRPPDVPDGTTLEVYAVAANANGAASGDAATALVEDWVYGCDPQVFYRDWDEDGYGRDTDTIVRCAGPAPSGYSAVGGDCDDFRPEVNPGAVEKCNGRDDNCNGRIDEDAELVELWPDNDGDGYYARREGEPLIGCVPTPGYAAEPGDCDDDNPDVHPGAIEICNYIDDNCNGRIDEYVRPRCGLGWCERESPTCFPEDCTPGSPTPERCTGADENCNGLVDEGDLCGAEQACIAGQCIQDPNDEPSHDPQHDSSAPSTEEPVDGSAASLGESSTDPSAPTSQRGCGLGLGGSRQVVPLLIGLGWFGWRRRRAADSRGAR